MRWFVLFLSPLFLLFVPLFQVISWNNFNDSFNQGVPLYLLTLVPAGVSKPLIARQVKVIERAGLTTAAGAARIALIVGDGTGISTTLYVSPDVRWTSKASEGIYVEFSARA